MSSQDRKYFRFRFCRVLGLLFLFITPTKTFTPPESCRQLGTALIKSQAVKGDAFTDEFNKYLTQCLASVDWQQLSDFGIQNFQELIAKIPFHIVKSVKGGLFLASLYLLYSSYQLYKEAVTLSENYWQHRQNLEELQVKVKVALKKIKTELYSKAESPDFTTMYEKIGILKMLNEFYTEFKYLTKDVQNDIIRSERDKWWAFVYGYAALVTCIGSFFFTGPRGVFVTCAPALGGGGYYLATFCYLEEANKKLYQLREDTNKLRLMLAEHQTQLQVALALMKGRPVDIYIRSEGCEDPERAPNTCGFAFIEVNGKDFSPHGRGCNVVVVDERTGGILERRAFDTHWDSGAANRLRGYLNSLNGNKIVLVAIQDEGSRFIKPALDALKRLGATDPILPDYRGSFAFVGYAGENKPPWITQKMAKRGLGPSEISLKIPITNSIRQDLSLNMFIFCSFVLVICFFTFRE